MHANEWGRDLRALVLAVVLAALLAIASGCGSDDAGSPAADASSAADSTSGTAIADEAASDEPATESQQGSIEFSVDTDGAPTDDWPLFVSVEGAGDQRISPSGGSEEVPSGSHDIDVACEYAIASDGTLLRTADVTPSSVEVDGGDTTEASVTLERVDPSSTDRDEYERHIETAYEYLESHVSQDQADELKAAAEDLLPPENAPPADNGRLVATFVDVGQGDAAIVQLPDDRTMLVDAGPSSDAAAVTAALRARGISRIDFLVATHPDADHIAGMARVLSSFDVGQVWAPAATNNTQTFEGFLDAIEAKGLMIDTGCRGKDIVSPDDASYGISILGPSSVAETTNDSSLVIRVSYGSTSFLLTGDADASDIAADTSEHVDVLKVSHHGSRTGTTLSLMRSLTPKVAVISYALDNSYGHPTQETLDALEAVGAEVYGTGANGTVTVTSDGTNVSVSCERTGTVMSPAEGLKASGSSDNATQDDDQGETVYITPYGKKYHRAGCRYLKKSNGGTAMSKSTAVAQGYEACRVCKP